MLDGTGVSSSQLPPAIVVGRTLSSYTVPGIQNNQETITYTVYNEQADPETGVLLTTTLEPGVTYASATQAPVQSGQNLAWSLGTIQGFDRASVTVTVNLANPVPLQLDTGAGAVATLDGGSVKNSTAPAILNTHTISADPAGLDPRRQHHRSVHPGRGGTTQLRPATDLRLPAYPDRLQLVYRLASRREGNLLVERR